MKDKYLKLFLLLVIFSTTIVSKSQTYVTIPDTNFVNWLQSKYPSCMNGNQLDITCNSILSATGANIINQSISNLDGIQYFTSLGYLNCMDNQLSNLPSLPSTLKNFQCQNNLLTSLPVLPDSLTDFYCDGNKLTTIPNLPNNLKILSCSSNLLTSLPVLPNTINQLWVWDNQLTSLPVLPDSLIILSCHVNQLTSLPTLPPSLTNLMCLNNQLTNLPSLPNNLYSLYCSNNPLTNLPTLPNSLNDLYCDSTTLSNLPPLPNSLRSLSCKNNNLTSIPIIPNTLQFLTCNNNNLNELPPLPSSLVFLDCTNNNISCFPTFPANTYYGFKIGSNPFSCLPNYVSGMDSLTLLYPLCTESDLINNPNACNGLDGIIGNAYKDNNTNCLMDVNDYYIANIPIKLYDNSNNLISQFNTLTNGTYNFSEPVGTYKIVVDTLGMPYTVNCAFPGVDTLVTLTISNTLAENINFNIGCKTGFDIGVQSILTDGFVFPGQQHKLRIIAGNLYQWYGMNCPSATNGSVSITVSGPVSFISEAQGALVPNVNGNNFSYQIADFSQIDLFTDFGLLFKTDTTAQSGDTICISVNVTPEIGDNNTTNNTYYYCYNVVNSLDPNMKEVYPIDVSPGYNDYLTYTIHFQNTGNAPAFNIRLVDTLSSYLNLETFQVINYSHYCRISLIDNIINVRFPNIMLPDSTTNAEKSKGFIQFKIKPKNNLLLGTSIKNTAFIYFDYNAPISTNTTDNKFILTSNVFSMNVDKSLINIYPNPNNGIFSIESLDNINCIEIIDILGESIKTIKPSSKRVNIDLSNYINGIYSIKIYCDNKITSKRIVKLSK